MRYRAVDHWQLNAKFRGHLLDGRSEWFEMDFDDFSNQVEANVHVGMR